MTARRVVSWVVVALVVGALWMFVAPRQVGGSTSYVTIEGTSMEPDIVTGDLVVLRQQSDYAVGDVVAFRSDMAGALVLHRIVGTNGDRFILQGDNNDFLDRYQPTEDEVLGRQILHFPGAAGVADFFASPAYLAFAVLVAVTLVLLAAMTATRRNNRRRRRRSDELPDDDHHLLDVDPHDALTIPATTGSHDAADHEVPA